MKAQSTDPFDADFEITSYNTVRQKVEPRAFRYGFMLSLSKAQELKTKAEKTKSRKELDALLKSSGINSILGAARKGNFTETVVPGGAIFAILPDEVEVVIIPISAGKKKYRYIGTDRARSKWPSNCDGVGFLFQLLDEATGYGRRAETDTIAPPIGRKHRGYQIFPISFSLLSEYSRKDCRLIVQPYAVDCSNNDTLAYLRPIVYESPNYHELQDKRKYFDFFKVDPLAIGYDSTHVIIEGEKIRVEDTVWFHMPDIKGHYMCPYNISLEDYHHQYHTRSVEGSPLEINPFKFLDFTAALGEMELTDEFQKPAESKFGKDAKALKLQFESGKDVFIDDSANWAQLDEMVKYLDDYGDNLIKFDIEGFASPEGSYATNERLARKRAENAANAIRQRMRKRVNNPNYKVTVCTWEDVVTELKRRGKMEDAAVVQELIDTKKGDIYGAVKALPQYEEVILPVLESQRRMSCSIMFQRAHVLENEEAAEQYYKNKLLPESDKWKFSEGDFYNLLYYVTDSADLDTITVMAYEYCKRNPEYLSMKLSPYVANRMAMIAIKRGTPDPTILDPFLDYSTRAVHFKRAVDELTTITVNRREHLMNQSIVYFMQEKVDTAQHWLDKLMDIKLVPVNLRPNGAEALQKFIDFESLHADREPDEEEKYQEAKNFVLSVSDENKAILYTEIPEWKEPFLAEKYTNLMDDENPKKWYLKGLQWASEEKIKSQSLDGLLPNTDSGEFHKLSEEEASKLFGIDLANYQAELKAWEESRNKNDDSEDSINVSNIPFFFAYFQHCFDMEPSFQRYYYQDGHLLPQFRRAHKYKVKQIPAYRKLFELLKKKDDETRQAAISNSSIDLEQEVGEESNDVQN